MAATITLSGGDPLPLGENVPLLLHEDAGAELEKPTPLWAQVLGGLRPGSTTAQAMVAEIRRLAIAHSYTQSACWRLRKSVGTIPGVEPATSRLTKVEPTGVSPSGACSGLELTITHPDATLVATVDVAQSPVWELELSEPPAGLQCSKQELKPSVAKKVRQRGWLPTEGNWSSHGKRVNLNLLAITLSLGELDVSPETLLVEQIAHLLQAFDAYLKGLASGRFCGGKLRLVKGL